MSLRTKRLIMVFAAIQFLLAGGILALPRVVEALPDSYKEQLAERSSLAANVMDMISTPYPTLTPLDVALQDVVIPEIQTQPVEATATNEPTFTPEPAVESTTEILTEEAPTSTPSPAPTATATPTATPSPVPTVAPPPAAASIDGLIVHPQQFNNCGPANLSMVLTFLGRDTSQTEAADYLKPNIQDRNVSPWQMVDYVNEFMVGYSAKGFSGGDLTILKQFVSNGLPVIIEKGYDPGRGEGWYGHYLTLHSYDDEGLVFYSKDTYLGPFEVGRDRIDSYAEIMEGWRQFNYTFLVVYPDEQEELVNSILGREYLDSVTMWQNAARKAEAETQDDPEDPFAWFNLGTSLTRIGEITGDAAFYQQGASAFDRAVTIGLPGRMLWYQFRIFIAYMKMERYEDMITLVDNLQGNADARVREGAQYVEELYLYKGHALAFLGNIADARAAYEQGLALNENSYPIQWALDSIQ